MSDRDSLQTFLVLGVVVVGGLVLWRLSKAAGGLVTGNNAITQTATNAAGQPVTAYQGAGVVGTIGAATNAASGGYLATLGQSIGDWVFDTINPGADKRIQPRNATQGDTGGATSSGWDYTGKDQTFEQASAEDGWWPYPLVQLYAMPQGVS